MRFSGSCGTLISIAKKVIAIANTASLNRRRRSMLNPRIRSFGDAVVDIDDSLRELVSNLYRFF